MVKLFLTILFSINAAPETEQQIAFAHTESEAAFVGGPARITPQLKDHYGNPDRFQRYIISVPRIHA